MSFAQELPDSTFTVGSVAVCCRYWLDGENASIPWSTAVKIIRSRVHRHRLPPPHRHRMGFLRLRDDNKETVELKQQQECVLAREEDHGLVENAESDNEIKSDEEIGSVLEYNAGHQRPRLRPAAEDVHRCLLQLFVHL